MSRITYTKAKGMLEELQKGAGQAEIPTALLKREIATRLDAIEEWKIDRALKDLAGLGLIKIQSNGTTEILLGAAPPPDA